MLSAPNAEMGERQLPMKVPPKKRGETTSNVSPATIALLMTGAQKIIRFNFHCAYSFVLKYFGLFPQCSTLRLTNLFLFSHSTCHVCCGPSSSFSCPIYVVQPLPPPRLVSFSEQETLSNLACAHIYLNLNWTSSHLDCSTTLSLYHKSKHLIVF